MGGDDRVQGYLGKMSTAKAEESMTIGAAVEHGGKSNASSGKPWKSPLGSGTQEGIWQGSLSRPAVEHTHNEMSLQTRRMSKLSLVYV